MASSGMDKKGLESHSELSPQQKQDDFPDPELEQKEAIQRDVAEILATVEDDPMMVDFDESQWVPCIPGLSLTLATVIFAIIGAGVGVAIALAEPRVNYDTTTVLSYVNITKEMFDSNATYHRSDIDIIDLYKINDTLYVDYTLEIATFEEIKTTDPLLDDNWTKLIAFPGTLWVNALKLLVLPLIVLMMVVLPSRVDEIGFIGKRAVPLYLFTSTCAAIQGTIWAWVIAPGSHGIDAPDIEARDVSSNAEITELDALLNIFTVNMVPKNIVSAMANLTILGVLLFFLVIGILLRRPNVKPVERDTVLNFSRAVLRCCMMAVVWVIWFTPIGMCSLVCTKIGTTDNLGELLGALGLYIVCVLVGHTIHLFGFYPLVFFATTRGNGWKWFATIYEAPLVAFATSSSAATLPKSLTVAARAGVRRCSYQFILPLGAAINMDGTALGFPIMVALIAQLNDVDIDAGQVFLVMILSVIVSVGTAPIPNAGMVYITMLFEAAGMGEYAGEGLATLFVLDWFVDRIETAVNVTSDQFVAKIIDEVMINSEKEQADIKCGCCLFGGGSGTKYAQTETSTPIADKEADKEEQTETV